MSENRNHNTVRLAKMGMLVAIAIVLVYFIHFPIFPAVAFLEYDPADIPILMGTFAFGPVAGILLTVVTAVIQGVTVSAASGLYGIIMHIISTSTLVIVAGVIYQKHKTRKTALIGLVCGVLAMTVVMIGGEYDHNAAVYGCSEKCGVAADAVYRRIQCDQSRYQQHCDVSIV